MKYVAYIRVAHEDNMAVEMQKNYIDYYANIKNIKVDKYYIDNGFSGTNFDRPKLKQLLKDVEDKKITKGILINDTSRIVRGIIEIQKIKNKLLKYNVDLISTKEEKINNIAIYCRIGNDKQDEEDELKKLSFKLQGKIKELYRHSFINKKIG